MVYEELFDISRKCTNYPRLAGHFEILKAFHVKLLGLGHKCNRKNNILAA